MQSRLIYSKFSVYFVVFLMAVLVLIILHLKGWLRPVESGIAQLPRPFVYLLSKSASGAGTFFSFFNSVASINQMNAQLKERVRGLEQENVSLQQYKLENEILRKELDYRNTTKLNLLSASVIGRDPSGLSQSVMLNVGSANGVKNGDAVTAQGVLVGEVVETETFTSKVLLVNDPQSSIDAQLSASGENGILRGSYGSGMVLDSISQQVKLNPGDEVVTAGLTNQIPRGILIGSIGVIQSQKTDLLQKATVISGTDLKNLIFVAVVK